MPSRSSTRIRTSTRIGPGVEDARRHPRLPLLHRAGPLRRHEPGAARPGRAAARTGPGHPGAHGPLRQHGPVRLVPGDRPRPSSASQGDRVTAARRRLRCATPPRRRSAQPDWEEQVFAKTNLEKIFLTNEFDDPLEGFDTNATCRACGPTISSSISTSRRRGNGWRRRPASRSATRLACGRRSASCSSTSRARARRRARSRCRRTSRRPETSTTNALDEQMHVRRLPATRRRGVFWMLAEHCREFKLPFDLMIGVNRRVYRERASTRGRTCSTSARR